MSHNVDVGNRCEFIGCFRTSLRCFSVVYCLLSVEKSGLLQIDFRLCVLEPLFVALFFFNQVNFQLWRTLCLWIYLMLCDLHTTLNSLSSMCGGSLLSQQNLRNIILVRLVSQNVTKPLYCISLSGLLLIHFTVSRMYKV